ncbi:MAG: hypothetical protein K2O06_07870 [Acetatifactor sp.]|nr:hypothetical protein [Acetatifactor sp.]
MKSTITQLYDYKQSVIPQEMRLWRVKDDEVQAQLETLSRNHAFETDVEEVQNGDSVVCSGDSEAPRWNREVLLFYPGRGICPPEFEDACLGAKVGEVRTVSAAEGNVKLTVRRIVRRSSMAIGDDLVKLEGISGVAAVADYDRWYREEKGAFYRQRANYQCAGFLLEEVQKKSDIFIDQEEKDAWMWERINTLYDAFVAAGCDPKIPEEGFDFLTEEQAKEKMYREQEWAFTSYVVHAYMAEMLSGQTMDQICQEGLEKMAAEHDMTVDELRATSCDAMIYGKFAMEKAMEQLGAYAEQFLED